MRCPLHVLVCTHLAQGTLRDLVDGRVIRAQLVSDRRRGLLLSTRFIQVEAHANDQLFSWGEACRERLDACVCSWDGEQAGGDASIAEGAATQSIRERASCSSCL